MDFIGLSFWVAKTGNGKLIDDEDDFGKLARKLENASPLQIMDKALEIFGNNIAIAFRYFGLLWIEYQLIDFVDSLHLVLFWISTTWWHDAKIQYLSSKINGVI